MLIRLRSLLTAPQVAGIPTAPAAVYTVGAHLCYVTLQIFDLVSGTMPCAEAVERSETDEVAPGAHTVNHEAVPG